MATALARADTRDLLPAIDIPTLLLWGDADVRSPIAVARDFHAAVAGSQLVVLPGAGHVSNLERPEAFNAAVRGFAKRSRNLAHNGDSQFQWRRAAAAGELRKVLPVDEFLGNVMPTIDAADLIDLHNIGLHKRGGGLRFHMKAAHIGLIVGQLPLKHFECHLATQRTLLSKINVGHCSPTQAAQQAIVAQLPAR